LPKLAAAPAVEEEQQVAELRPAEHLRVDRPAVDGSRLLLPDSSPARHNPVSAPALSRT